MKFPASQSATITAMKSSAKSPLMKWGIVLVLTLIHLALLWVYKEDYAGALSILPVGVAGWFFGSMLGIVTAIVIVFLYFFILYISGISTSAILDSDFILGGFILIFLGGVLGWLSNYYYKQTEKDKELKKQLEEADALSEISIALSQAERVGLSNILQLIVDSAKKLIPAAEQAVIHILDEDNPDTMMMVKRALESRGYKLLEASTGLNGVATAEDNEVARRLRTSTKPSLAYIPIIAITANALKGDAEKVLSAGYDVYMPKPINIRELWARVEAFVPAPETK